MNADPRRLKGWICCFILGYLLFLIMPGRAFASTNPGYRGLSYQERTKIEAGIHNGARVNTWNGNVVVQRTLFAIPGKGLPVEILLTYNSDRRSVITPFGAGWNMSYNIRYTEDGDGNVRIAWGDGRQDRFSLNRRRGFDAPAGVYMTLAAGAAEGYRLKTKHGIEFRFDNATHRKLTSIVDPNGNTITLNYGAFPYRLESIQDAGGRTYGFNYDTEGRLSRVADPNLGNRFYEFTYDNPTHQMTAIADPLGVQEGFLYDPENLLTGIDNKRGNSSTIDYETPPGDANTRRFSASSKMASVIAFEYDNASRTTTGTNPNLNMWKYEYDSAGRISRIIDPADVPAVFEWDDQNNPLALTDREGERWSYTYDPQGNMLTATDPLTNTVTRTYDPVFNRLATLTNQRTNQTQYFYDPRGNLTRVRNAKSEDTDITYDAMGQAQDFTDALNHATAFTYDANGNVDSVTDALNNRTEYLYDGASRLIEYTDPNKNTTTYTYDNLDRMVSATNPLNDSLALEYDENGNTTSLTDRNNNRSEFQYDEFDRLTRSTDPLTNFEQFAYDSNGRLTEFTDKRSKVYSFTYDARDRVIQRMLPLSRTYSFDYDNNGKLTSRTDPNGVTVTYVYDEVGRITRRNETPTESTTYVYDAVGNMTSASNAISSFNLAYDELDRLTQLTDNTMSKSLMYEYDAAGRKVTADRPDGTRQTYNYDNANRLTRIGTSFGNVDYENDEGGRRISREYPNGVKTTYAYDDANRLASTESKNGGTTIQSFYYKYDPEGNPTETLREDGTKLISEYDELHRLILDNNNDFRPFNLTYQYDAVNNMTQASGTPQDPTSVRVFTFDDLNQLNTETGKDSGQRVSFTHTYDQNGNMLTRSDSLSPTAYTYQYDTLNRITVSSVLSTFTGLKNESYKYDALGRLYEINKTSPGFGEFSFSRLFYDIEGHLMNFFDDTHQAVGKFWHNDIPIRQVAIQARIVIANNSVSKNLGVQWGAPSIPRGRRQGAPGGYIGSDVGTGNLVNPFQGQNDNPTGGTFNENANLWGDGRWTGLNALYAQFNNQNTFGAGGQLFSSVINGLLGSDGTVQLQTAAFQTNQARVLSSPKVIATNAREATIASGTAIPYQTVSSEGQASVAFKEAVLELIVTPQITPDDRVIMDVIINGNPAPFAMPSLSTQTATTNVLIQDGQTIVLGGIYSENLEETKDKGPLLGDIPILGALFKSRQSPYQRSNLVIFVTPHIIDQ